MTDFLAVCAVVLCGLFIGGLLNLCINGVLGEQTKFTTPRFWVVTLLNAGLYLAAYHLFSLSPRLLLYAAFYSVLLVISCVDIYRRVIYVWMNTLIVFLGIAACFLLPTAEWYDRPAGIFAASLPLFLIFLITRGGMGFGDVELAAAAGFLLGLWPALFALFAASVASSVIGIIVGRVKGTGLKTAIPFGPFLAFGFILVSFFFR